ncbi:MAG: efflux RND transporter permease subunit [Acidobacteriota bacterium]
MIKTLSELPLRRPVGTVMLLVSLIVLGGVSLTKLPLGFMPSFDEPEIDVEIEMPGGHPMEVLRQAVLPVEGAVATVSGTTDISGFVRSSSAKVEVRFDWSEDMDIKLLEVREAVEAIRDDLPDTVTSFTVEVDSEGGGAILEGRISAERDLSESWALLDRRIRRPLERIKGIARVNLYGVEPPEVKIDLDLDALRALGLTVAEVVDALRRGNLDLDAGVLRSHDRRYDVRLIGRIDSIEVLRELPIGQGRKLAEVAEVTRREPRLDYGRHLDRRFAIGIDVYKEPSANTVEVVAQLKQRIAEIEQDPELSGIKLLVWEDAAEQILNSLGTLRSAGIQGGLLAILILLLFLRSFRNTLIVATAIPFSLLATCGAMLALGLELNVLTMMGLMLGIGLLVDNAVVVMENIHRHQDGGAAAMEAARLGVREVFLAVVASTMTTVIVWIWLFLFERSELTILMGEVATVICLTVACSLLISVTFIPMAAARLSRRKLSQDDLLTRRILPAYRRMLGWTLRHRLLTAGILLVLWGSSKYPLDRIEKSGEPSEQESFVTVRYDVHDPSTKEVLEGYVDQVEAWIDERREHLGYESLYSWFSENQGTMTRLYLPPEKRTKAEVAALKEKLQGKLPDIAGVTLRVGQRDWWRRRGGRGDGRSIGVSLHGEDPDYLQELSAQAERLLSDIPGALEVQGVGDDARRELRVAVDPERSRTLGFAPEDVGRNLSFVLRGQRLRRFPTADGELETRLGVPEESLPGSEALGSLELEREDGESVPVSSLARLESANTPPRINRSDRAITQWVRVKFDPSVTTPEGQQLVADRLSMLPFPEGYGFSFGRWGRDREEALDTMFLGLGLSIMLVLLLMASLFESFFQPAAVGVTLILAQCGAAWSLWGFGHELDPVAAIGLIMLVGIVVNNGIVMVLHVNDLRAGGLDRREALLTGCSDRFRPVLMTAITTIVGLVPLALSASTVAGIYLDGLGVAVMGGLISSTLFTLVGLPVWYSGVEDVAALLRSLLPKGRGLKMPETRVLSIEPKAVSEATRA